MASGKGNRTGSGTTPAWAGRDVAGLPLPVVPLWSSLGAVAAASGLDQERTGRLLEDAVKEGRIEVRTKGGQTFYRSRTRPTAKKNHSVRLDVREVPLRLPFNRKDWTWLQNRLGTWMSAERIAPTAGHEVEVVQAQIARGLAGGWLTQSRLDVRQFSLIQYPKAAPDPEPGTSAAVVWEALAQWQTNKALTALTGVGMERVRQLLRPLISRGLIRESEVVRWWYVRTDRLPPPFEHRVLCAPVAALGLPAALEWSLAQEGVLRVGDLVSRSELDLGCIPELSGADVTLIEEVLDRAGLFLGTVLPEWPLPDLPPGPFVDPLPPSVREEREIYDRHLREWTTVSEFCYATGISGPRGSIMLAEAANQGYLTRRGGDGGTGTVQYILTELATEPDRDEAFVDRFRAGSVRPDEFVQASRLAKLAVLRLIVASGEGLTVNEIAAAIPGRPDLGRNHAGLIRSLLTDMERNGYLRSEGRWPMRYHATDKELPVGGQGGDAGTRLAAIADYVIGASSLQRTELAPEAFPYRRLEQARTVSAREYTREEWAELGPRVTAKGLSRLRGITIDDAFQSLAKAVETGALCRVGKFFALPPAANRTLADVVGERGVPVFASWARKITLKEHLGVPFHVAQNLVDIAVSLGLLVRSDLDRNWFIDVRRLPDPASHRLLGAGLDALRLLPEDKDRLERNGVTTVADLLRLDGDGVAEAAGEAAGRILKAMALRWLEPGKGVAQVPPSSYPRTEGFDPLPPPCRAAAEIFAADALKAWQYADRCNTGSDRVGPRLRRWAEAGFLMRVDGERYRVHPRWESPR